VDLGHAALRREPDARLAVEALGQDLEREVGSGVVVDEAAPAAHVGVLGVHVQVIMHLHNVLARHAHTTLHARLEPLLVGWRHGIIAVPGPELRLRDHLSLVVTHDKACRPGLRGERAHALARRVGNPYAMVGSEQIRREVHSVCAHDQVRGSRRREVHAQPGRGRQEAQHDAVRAETEDLTPRARAPLATLAGEKKDLY